MSSISRDDAGLAAFFEKHPTHNMFHGLRRNLLAFGPGVAPTDLMNKLCSVDNGCVVPFRADREFAGVVDGVGREKGQYLASLLIEGFTPVRIKKFSHKAKPGTNVFVSQRNRSVIFSLSDHAGVEIGVLARIDNPGSGDVMVSFSLPQRPRA